MACFEGSYRVRFADVDHAGIVYFAKILDYCHWALEDMQREAGVPLERWFDTLGVGAPLVDVHVQYHHPLRHGELMHIEMGFEKLGPRSMISRYWVRRDDTLCAEVRIVQVIIEVEAFGSCALPEELERALAPYMLPAE